VAVIPSLFVNAVGPRRKTIYQQSKWSYLYEFNDRQFWNERSYWQF
jgi:hypothetical protein